MRAAKPKPNFNLLDRFLIMMEYQKVPVTICFNKCDLLTGEELHAFSDVYEQCGYPVVYTSAREQRGIDVLLERLEGKVTSVAGPSGGGQVIAHQLSAAGAPDGDWGNQQKD